MKVLFDPPSHEQPGTMLAAHVMLVRTGAPEWEAAWIASAESLWQCVMGDASFPTIDWW